MYHSLAASLASMLMLTSSFALADVPGDRSSGEIELVPPNPLLERAQAYLESERVKQSAKRSIRRVVERDRKNGVRIPEPKARETLPEMPRGSLNVDLVSGAELHPGEQFQLQYDASVVIPESAHGQFVVEVHFVKEKHRSSNSLMTLGRG